jgi:hypothetical protein
MGKYEKFEYTKGIIRYSNSKVDRPYNGHDKKDRQYNGHDKKDKTTNTDL